MKYRSRTDIVTSILNTAIEGATKTKIMYVAYMSFSQTKEYLSVLLENGLVEFEQELKTYKTTDKGLAFLKSTEIMAGMFDPTKSNSSHGQLRPD